MAVSKIKTIYVVDFNSVEDHVRWLNENRVHHHNLRRFPAKAILLDFSLSKFLEPYHIAPLACMVHEYQSRGFKVKILKANAEILSYLKSFGFDQFCNSLESNGAVILEDKKTFPLWHINESEKEFYTIQVQEYYEKNLFSGQDLFVLGNSLAELMNNIFDHSDSKIPGYTFTQLNTRSNSIITCVCDFGIGIPTSVNNYLSKENLPTLEDDKALFKAFELKFSAQTKPHNRGFGWDTIFTSLKSLQGKLHIVSNNAIFLLRENGTTTSELLKSNFPGTLVVITLNTNNLPLKEEISDELAIF